MFLYLRCVWANKFTLAGYILLPVAASTWFFGLTNIYETIWLISLCISALAFTAFGLDTYRECRRSLDDLRLHGRLRSGRVRANHRFYCNRVGYSLAKRIAKEGSHKGKAG